MRLARQREFGLPGRDCRSVAQSMRIRFSVHTGSWRRRLYRFRVHFDSWRNGTHQ